MSHARSNSTNREGKTKFVWVKKPTPPNVKAKSTVQYASTIKEVSENVIEFSQPASSSSSDSNQPSSKPTITPSSSKNRQGKTNYVWYKKAISSTLPYVKAQSSVKCESTVRKVSESTNEFSRPSSSSSSKSSLPSSKPTIRSLAPSTSTNPQGKTNYVLVQEDTLPTYKIPEYLKDLFERDITPSVLKTNITPSTYKKYFKMLLYAEDFYIEKWNGFQMKDVKLKIREATIYKRRGNFNVNNEQDEKTFVEFKMDSVPERRPFLLSRDFVTVRPSGKESASFKGVIYRVIKSNTVLVEFGEDFHQQHDPWCEYDVKFSFNRVCLKRAHQAISAATNPLLRNFLFPDSIPNNNTSSTPYIIEGPLSVKIPKSPLTSTVHASVLSKTGRVIRDMVLESYRTRPLCHILICAPTNKTCDVITRCLQQEIPDIFRSNAAFRESDGVPLEIFANCRFKEEVFSCPPLNELCQFKVVVSTFTSAFRLHSEGLKAGHFSQIFLVDASSTTEPEAMVALANLVNDETVVVVSGEKGNHSRWVRSNIARKHGLRVSFYERIRQCVLYQNLDSRFIEKLTDPKH